MVADHAVTKKLTSKPAFEWVDDCMATQSDIKANIIAMNSCTAKKFKFGVEIPNNTKHGLILDHLNGDSLWKEATDKELKSLSDHKTFREFTEGDDISECKRIPYHIIYNCKFDLRWKA